MVLMREKEQKLDCKGAREWVNSEDAKQVSRQPSQFINLGAKEQRDSNDGSSKQYENWGKIIYEIKGDFSIVTGKKNHVVTW